ncbi:MAG: FG-GAP-like repeat-containing protein [Ramlibacter sp.]|uniref:FG-GAP-like repeat-containing protein n=1 Tax=Ramlibacter sp. TaxID=1917967 RepID=UPI002627D721|nr:FG-GAP-like repeat-containing protein [Ramlibacter sp.]MDH4377474.1 FG-GAP-like repeat-containing protein [Ramlibacter sp.]
MTQAQDTYEYQGHHYELVKSAVSFQDALLLSETRVYQGMQGHLLTLSDHAESLALWTQFVFPYYYSNERATPWIALSDSVSEGTWVWMAGPEMNSVATFTDWASGEPNNLGNEDYAVLHWQREAGGWFDYPFSGYQGLGQWFIVEYEPWGLLNKLPTGTLSISGTATQGETIWVENSLADDDGIPSSGPGAVQYQWTANGLAIAGATSSTLLLSQALVGKAINVAVSYQDGGGVTEHVVSSPTSEVLDAAFETTGGVIVRGVARQGETLTAVSTLADLDGFTSMTYQWLADGVAIDGANASALTLTQDQVGKSISVAVSYVEGDGASGTVTASARVIASPLAYEQSNGWFASGVLHEMTGSGGGQPYALAISAPAMQAYAVWIDDAGQLRWVGTAKPWSWFGTTAQFLTSADIDGDGRPDLIARDPQGRYGTFLLDAPWTPYDVLSYSMYLPEFVSSGLDQAQVGNLAGTALVNGDAFADLILMSDNGWSVALGNGSGEFSLTGVTHELEGNQWSGNQGAQILSADFNHDGHTDLVVNARFASHLEVWLGDGEGGFSESFDISSYFLYSVDVGDLNDDGHQDLVLSGRTYLGDGTGSFQPGAQIVVPDGRSVYATRIADFNADGIQDVALALDSDGVILAIGNGQGGFSSQTQIGQGSGELTSLLAMDINADGLTDLLASGWLGGTKVFYSTEVAAAVVANVNDRPTGSVTIAGVARVGNTLQASDTLADLDGMGAVSYQWHVDGQDIPGATASTYLLQASDGGRQVTVVAQYTDLAGTLESANSTGVVIGISLAGTSGSERLVGSGGNDLITGGLGTDAMDGGNGSDLYLIGTSSEHAAAEVADSGTSGIDELRFAATAASTLTLFAGDTGIERVTLGTGTAAQAVTTGMAALNVNAGAVLNALTLQGNDGANTLTGTAFDDTLLGGGGNDALKGGGGNDTLTGGLGLDTFTVAAGTDTVTDLGQGGTDVLKVSAGATALATVHTAWTATSASTNAGTANLSTSGLAVNLAAITSGLGFAVTNTGAATTLTGSALADRLTGGSGNDTLTGGAGNDTLAGAGGDDLITGGLGVDAMDGGNGSDLYLIGTSSEHTAAEISDTGTSGVDELRFVATTASTLTLFAGDTGIERVTLGTGNGTSAITTGSTALNVNASAVLNALTLQGNDGANNLTGTAFDDTLLGGGGNDSLTGGLGNDVLRGSSGNDSLTGGGGVDRFVFDTLPNATTNRDTVTDFLAGVDLIQLSRTVFAALGSGETLGIEQFLSSSTATRGMDADDRIIYNTASGALYYDQDGSGATAAVQIALLGATSHPFIGYLDFQVIA